MKVSVVFFVTALFLSVCSDFFATSDGCSRSIAVAQCARRVFFWVVEKPGCGDEWVAVACLVFGAFDVCWSWLRPQCVRSAAKRTTSDIEVTSRPPVAKSCIIVHTVFAASRRVEVSRYLALFAEAQDQLRFLDFWVRCWLADLPADDFLSGLCVRPRHWRTKTERNPTRSPRSFW